MKAVYLFPMLFVLSGCAFTALEPQGHKVVIIDSLAASDLLHYEPVAELSSGAMYTAEDCLRDLRNQAGSLGADFVRVSSREPSYCAFEGWSGKEKKNCFRAFGQAFRKIRTAGAGNPALDTGLPAPR